MNFVHKNPIVCTSVGLTINREVVLGIIYNPVLKQLYTAIKGRGAFLNGKQVFTSKVKKLEKAMVLMELPTGAGQAKKDAYMKNISTLLDKAHAIRCPGN